MISLIDQMVKAKGATVTLKKVDELCDIMGYGVMRTPAAVVINGKLVNASDLPRRDKFVQWLAVV